MIKINPVKALKYGGMAVTLVGTIIGGIAESKKMEELIEKEVSKYVETLGK